MVCTANRCRSPMAEALLRRRLEERSVPARVSSAGFLASGWPAMEYAIATMADDGFDLTGHLSRTIRPQMVAESDLVVAMSRQHVVELLLLSPDRWSRVFQLRDLVRRAERVGQRSGTEPIDAWLAAVGANRSKSAVLAGSLADDIADPAGRDRDVYDSTKRILDDLLTRLAGLLG